MATSRSYLRFVRAVAVLYVLVGVFWTAVNLGDIPHYGDTGTYLSFARNLKVNEHRGIVYPWILAQAGRLFLDGEAPRWLGWRQYEKLEEGGRCLVPSGYTSVQLFQLFVGALSIFFFVQMTTPSAGGGRGKPKRRTTEILLLSSLLLFDPLISHFNLALMTDGLTFSACLVFCGALIALADRRFSPWVAGAALGAGFLLAAGLRVEKKWILLATFLLTSLLWAWARRRTVFPEGLKQRMAAAAALLCCSLALIVAVHKTVYKRDADWWPLLDTGAHFRLVFPYLSDVYDDLPERTKARLSVDDARRYDSHLNEARRVINRVTGLDDRLRREVTVDILKTVLPRRWGTILLDTARDALENTWGTFAFYVRVTAWHLGGNAAIRRWFFSDGCVWDYQRMASHHPRLTRAYLVLAAFVLLLALPLALRRLFAESRQRRLNAAILAPWVPCAALWIVNAFFFAAVQNIVNIRYLILSHAFLLVLVYRPAIQAVLETRDGPPNR